METKSQAQHRRNRQKQVEITLSGSQEMALILAALQATTIGDLVGDIEANGEVNIHEVLSVKKDLETLSLSSFLNLKRSESAKRVASNTLRKIADLLDEL